MAAHMSLKCVCAPRKCVHFIATLLLGKFRMGVLSDYE